MRIVADLSVRFADSGPQDLSTTSCHNMLHGIVHGGSRLIPELAARGMSD